MTYAGGSSRHCPGCLQICAFERPVRVLRDQFAHYEWAAVIKTAAGAAGHFALAPYGCLKRVHIVQIESCIAPEESQIAYLSKID